MAIELDRENYDTEVLKSNGTILVDFWGPQCAPCLALNPAVQRLEKKYGGRVKVGKVNASGNRMLCARLRVLGLPTFIVYKDGEEISRLTGEGITEEALLQALEAALN